MNPFHAAFVDSLAAWLADYYLLATLLLGGTFLGLRWVRQPANRLWVAWIVMIELGILAAVCSLPGLPRVSLMTAVSPAGVDSHLGLPPVATQDAGVSQSPFDARPSTSDMESASAAASALPSPALPSPKPLRSWRAWVSGGFLLGFAATGFWLGWGALATLRLRRSAAPASPAITAALSSLVDRQIGNRPLPNLLLSRQIDAAMAMGVLRPTILLPSTMAQETPPQSLRAILLHEWAHIRNRDLWLLALGRGLLTLLFAHPLYWWLRARIRDDQEALADAVAASDSRHDYALELIGWARAISGRPSRHVAAAVGIWESPSQLTRRIAMLLDETFRVQTAVSGRWKRRTLGGLILFGLIVSLLTWQPRPSTGQQGQTVGAPVEKATPTAKPKSLTVFPIILTSSDPAIRVPSDLSKRVTQVVGMLFERAGVREITLADAGLAPPEKADMARLGEAFAQFVVSRKITTDYALFAEYVGIPGKGIDEIRLVVVDPQGTIVLSEHADKQALAKLGEKKVDLMIAGVYLSGRLNDLLGLQGPGKKEASKDKAEATSEGKITEAWKKESGVPSKEELDAIALRQKDLRTNIKASTVAVYPIRIGRDSDAKLASALAKQLTEQGLGRAEATEVNPELKISGDYNGVKILWDTAKAFQDFLHKNPPAADYALYAQYLIGENVADRKVRVAGIQFIVCNRGGDWVIVGGQNSHSADFQRINPKSPEDCNRLLSVTLKNLLMSSSDASAPSSKVPLPGHDKTPEQSQEIAEKNHPQEEHEQHMLSPITWPGSSLEGPIPGQPATSWPASQDDTSPLRFAEAAETIARKQLALSHEANRKAPGSIPEVRLRELEIRHDLAQLDIERVAAAQHDDSATLQTLEVRRARLLLDLAEAQWTSADFVNKQVPGVIPLAKLTQLEKAKQLAVLRVEWFALQPGDQPAKESILKRLDALKAEM